MPEVSLSCHIAAAPNSLWNALLDVEGNSAGVETLAGARVVSLDGDRRVTEWCLLLRGAPMCWQQLEHIDAARKRVRISLLTGDPKYVSGTWELEPEGDGSHAGINLDFDFGFARIAPVLNNVLEPTLRSTIAALASNAARRANASGAAL